MRKTGPSHNNPYGSNESKQCCQPKIKTKGNAYPSCFWEISTELSDPYLENVSSNILQHSHNVQWGIILDFVSKDILQWKRQTIQWSAVFIKKNFLSLILYLKGWFNGWSFQIATYLQVAYSYVCNCQVLQICSKCKGLEVWVHRSRHHKLYIKMLNCTNGVYSNVAKVKCKEMQNILLLQLAIWKKNHAKIYFIYFFLSLLHQTQNQMNKLKSSLILTSNDFDMSWSWNFSCYEQLLGIIWFIKTIFYSI